MGNSPPANKTKQNGTRFAMWRSDGSSHRECRARSAQHRPCHRTRNDSRQRHVDGRVNDRHQ
jgi:hypothetical protein